jgi:hypothetical protein
MGGLTASGKAPIDSLSMTLDMDHDVSEGEVSKREMLS